MMQIQFNRSTGKWDGVIDGKVVFSSTNKYYVKQKLGKTAPAFQPTAKVSDVDINKRFDFVTKIVRMVASKTTASCIISGEGGLGKTYSVIKALKDNGMKDVTDLAAFEVGSGIDLRKSYRVVKGYSTAKGLFRTLQECNGSTIVFDDCDSILKDPVALNLLKGALDSYGDRYISWNADIRDDDLDKTFKFTGQVIFITNVTLDRLDQAVRSRAMCVDLSMTQDQKLDRMEVIAQAPEFLPEIEQSIKNSALSFLRKNLDEVANLSLRSLIQVCKIADSRDPQWEDLAKYVVTQGC